MAYSDEYKKKIIQQVLDGKSIDAVSKENHHSWRTVEAWLREYGHIQAEDKGEDGDMELLCTFQPHEIMLDGLRSDYPNEFYEDNEDEKICLECIRLQAKLEASEALVERLFKMIGGE